MSPAAVAYPSRLLDAVGLALALLAAIWTVASAAGRSAARPAPVLVLIAASIALYIAARRLAVLEQVLVPGLVAVGVAGAVVLGFPGIADPGGGPTGYGNANASLLALGSVAAAGATAVSRDVRVRRAGCVLAVALAGSISLTGSVAAAIAIGVAAALALASVLLRTPLLAVGGGMVAVLLTLSVTSAIAGGDDPLGLGERSKPRDQLWSSALETLRDEPTRGVGPGRYARIGAVSDDADLRWAHHGYLQQAAEQGIPGLLLLFGLVVWGYVRLAASSGNWAAHLVGASAITVVALHASVDHVLHHAAVTLTVVALVGWASGEPPVPADG